MHTHSHEYIAQLLNNARYEDSRGDSGTYCRSPYCYLDGKVAFLRIGHRELRDQFGRLLNEDPAPSHQDALEMVQRLHRRERQITLPGVSSRAPDMQFLPVAGGWRIVT